jgi:hypothetical protein
MKKIIFIILLFTNTIFSVTKVEAQNCPTGCNFAVTYYYSGGYTSLSPTVTKNFTCGQNIIDVSVTIPFACATNGIVTKTAAIYDATTNTIVSWSPSLTSLNNGGAFTFPINVTGNFYIQYQWGTTTSVCYSIKYPINISCPVVGNTCPTCTFTTALYSITNNTTLPPLSTAITNNISCNQSFDIIRTRICIPTTNILNITASFYDVNNITPSWANIVSLNNNLFTIPANTSGAYFLKYVWTMPGSSVICGSIIYPINITCTATPPVCNLTVTGLSKCISPTAATNSISAFITGGTAPFTYLWNTTPAQTTDILLNVMPGTYSVTVTDATGCIKTQALTINCPPSVCNFIANAGPDKTICQGISTTIGTTVLTPNGETYTWTSNPTSNIPSSSMPTVTPSVTTNYYLAVTKPNCPTKYDTVLVTVNNCCNCQTANCKAKYFYINAIGGNVALACGQTKKLECNKVYPFVATTSCQSNCTATVNADLYNGSILVQSYTNISNTNYANINFTTSGNYNLVYHLIVNGIECQKCPIKIIVNCPPPSCVPCNAIIISTAKYSIFNDVVRKFSFLVQSFNFSGLPTNITEVRAVVTDVKTFAVDLNGNANEECLSCNNSPHTWGSIIGADPIGNIAPTINFKGVELNTPIPINIMLIYRDKNSRQVTWKNGTIFNVTNPIKLNFLLPPFSALSCCTRKATICIKFIFRNDKCEECVVRKCFDVEIK